MIKLGELLTRHRNLFLLLLLIMTLFVSGISNRERLENASATVDIPVIETFNQPVNALEAYRLQRDQEALTDLAALENLCAQSALDDRTRQDAALQLQSIITNRQVQSALEGALLNSSLSPCVAVVSEGSVTIITGKKSITNKDAALAMTLAAAHADAAPENVRIITAE